MGETILQVNDLTCTVRGKAVLDGLSLRLETGHVYALLGEAGSGKTTLLRVLAGLIPADGGSAEIGGIPVTDPASRRETGMLVDEPALWNELSIAGNLEMQSRILGKVDRRRMGKIMKALSILPREAGNRRLGGSPQSIRVRAAAAMAFLGAPKLLLLDEVFSGLDSDDGMKLTEFIRSELEARPMAVLLTGSFLGLMWHAATDFLLLKNGRIRGRYTKADLTARLPEEFGSQDIALLQEALEKEGAE